MKRIATSVRIASIALVVVLGVASLAGCAMQQSEEQTAQEQNQAYMSQVNETMESLESKLAGFVDAVSRGDVVNMRTQAENAYAALDELSALEAPEALKDIHDSYVNGTAELKNALNSYIDLYTEIESATEADPFDWSTFDARIAAIKAQYDAGMTLLQTGDTIAAEKE